jgi:hypothetical protein
MPEYRWDRGRVPGDRCRERVPGADPRLIRGQSALVVGCGWWALPELVLDGLQAFLGLGDIGVVGAEPALEDRQGALVVGTGRRQLTEDAEHVPEVSMGAGHIRVLGAEPALKDG